MQFVGDQVEVLFRIRGLRENGHGLPQYVVAEGKPVVHLTTGEILVSLAQILPIAVNGIQGINDFLHMIPC